MSSVYQKAGQLLANWHGEDASHHADPYSMARNIVQLVMDELRSNGVTGLDQIAAHDQTTPD